MNPNNSELSATKKIYALLVGIDQCAPDSEVPTLKGCENDIKAIEAYLKDQIAGEWELFEPRILTNEQATRQAIIDGFQEYLSLPSRKQRYSPILLFRTWGATKDTRRIIASRPRQLK
ncbi:MAG: hypothetical protein QNJ74_05930 [Trichodesmium sp. MO_231.B1]|nr:hypothetical protein [Trichodesmium sp. MO_231.B1]